MKNLYRLFTDKDMDMLEINPFCVLKDGVLKLLDAKMAFDGNAMYRHADIAPCGMRPRKTRRNSPRPSST